MSEIRPLARKGMIGWAAGDFGFNIFWQSLRQPVGRVCRHDHRRTG